MTTDFRSFNRHYFRSISSECSSVSPHTSLYFESAVSPPIASVCCSGSDPIVYSCHWLDQQCSGTGICTSAPTENFLHCRVTGSASIMGNRLSPLLIIISLLKWSHQDTVEQPVAEITVEEGNNVTLSCTLKTTDPNPYVYWYSQQLGQPPHYMFRLIGGNVHRNTGITVRFSATFDKAAKITELTIGNTLISDTAVYFCAMQPTLLLRCSRTHRSHGDSVTHLLSSDVKTEGEAVTLSCTYDTTWSDYSLYWYRQHLDTQPEFVLWKYTGGGEDKADFAKIRFCVKLQTATKFTNLTISWPQLTDAAIIKLGDQPLFNEECRMACQMQQQAYAVSAYETTNQDYLHAKQRNQHAIDWVKRSHDQRIRSTILPHPVVNGGGQLNN
ncbi:uncharacterized protein [Heterodontus francisci]|uniref:uncharacterized protein n=1 Tax=Heterodontus francisci TaxID=7792 RepID=UPI00355BB8C2